jgi:hypothetical protein
VVYWYIDNRRLRMQDVILVGRGRAMFEHSVDAFRAHLEEALRTRSPRLAFMSPEHHLVRDAAVTELPRAGKALSPEAIARRTGLALERVGALLDELESHLFFLVRDGSGHVSWAFPVTSEPTPHRLHFSTGESINAA